MKKYSLVSILTIAVILFSIAASPRVSTTTDTTARFADGYRITTVTWIADSTGTVLADTSVTFIRGIIQQFVTIPDTSTRPAIADSSGRYPTDNYDISLTSLTEGLDIAGNALADRDDTLTERNVPWLIQPVSGDSDTLFIPYFSNGKFITTVTNNSIPDATGRILIYWQEK